MHLLMCFLIIVLSLLFGGCVDNCKENLMVDMPKENLKIVAFGDSITEAVAGLEPEQKWTTLLEKKLNSRSSDIRWAVVNSGIGGNTSREGLARIEKDVISHKPDIVLVEFGGNDATNDPHRAVSIEEFNRNMAMMYEKINGAKAQMVLLTFTPVIDDWHSVGKHEKYAVCGGFDHFVEFYRQATREFAKEKSLKLIDIDVDLRKACITYSQDQIILKDGVHLTAKANEIVAEIIYDCLMGI